MSTLTDTVPALKHPSLSDQASSGEDPDEKLGYNNITKEEYNIRETEMKKPVRNNGKVV